MRSLQTQAGWYSRMQWIMAAALLAAAGMFYVAGYCPLTSRLGALRQRIAEQEADLAANQARARNLPTLSFEVLQLEKRVEGFDRQFPRQPQLGQFIRDLTQISQQLSLSDWKYQPGAPKRGESLFEMPIQMHFCGDFMTVTSFLRQVEDMQRMTRVQKLGMKTKDAKAGTVEVDLTMSVYFAEG